MRFKEALLISLARRDRKDGAVPTVMCEEERLYTKNESEP
jgi:hypothetical protein